MSQPFLKEMKAYIEVALARLDEDVDSGRVVKRLATLDEAFRETTPSDFKMEYDAALLALVTLSWEKCCEQALIKESEIQKLFLRSVMERFESPAALPTATLFSEYLQLPGSEDTSLVAIAIAKHLFKRLKRDKSICHEGRDVLSPAFQAVVESFESLRTSFENEIDELFWKAGQASDEGNKK